MDSFILTRSDIKSESECQHFLLTIVVPTYNRLQNLEQLCNHLSDNIGPRTKVVVVDNCSASNYKKSPSLKVLTEPEFTFCTNKYHIGPDANVLRAIELADTPWIYLLGDSKIPRANMLKEMESDCQEYSDAMGIVYRFRSVGDHTRQLQSVHELQNKQINLGDFFLGGNSLISRKAVAKYLSTASMYTLSRMPHSLFHILALANSESVILSSKKIMDKFLRKPKHYNPKLSLLECWAQFGLIMSLPLPLKDLKILNRKILDMEDASSRITMLKFGLIQIFRNRIDIRPYTKRILKYRYTFTMFCYESVLVLGLHIVAIVFAPLAKRTKA